MKRSLKDGAIFLLRRRRKELFWKIFARRKISIDEVKRVASKGERKDHAKNLSIENIAYEYGEKGGREEGKAIFDEVIIKINYFLGSSYVYNR